MLKKKTTKRVGIRLFGFRILREKSLQQNLEELVKEKYNETIEYLLSYAANFAYKLRDKEDELKIMISAASYLKKKLDELTNIVNLAIFDIVKNYFTPKKFKTTLNFLTKRISPLVVEVTKRDVVPSKDYLEKKLR